MDRTTERALKRAVRDEAAVRLRGDAVGPDAVEALIRRLVEEIASESGISLPPYEFEGLASAMIDDFLRYGPLQRLLEDESVTEIMVNGGGIDLDDPALPFRAPIVYVERAGRIEYRPDVEFDDAEHVRRIINKIAESRASDATTRTPWAARCCREAGRAPPTWCRRSRRTGRRSTCARSRRACWAWRISCAWVC